MDTNNWRPTQGGDPAMDSVDWRTQLRADTRQRIVIKITETLERHLPFHGQEWLQDMKKIAVRFEEKIYTVATSQSDYLRKISLKMLTMETKSQNTMPNSMQSNSAGNGKNPPDPGHETTISSREFTSFHTISSSEGFTSLKTISRCTEAEDSARRSLRSRSVESTLNSTRRTPNICTQPSGNRSYLDHSPSKINEPVHSETGSSYCFKLLGVMVSASQYQGPTMNVYRGDSSLPDAPCSEASAGCCSYIGRCGNGNHK